MASRGGRRWDETAPMTATCVDCGEPCRRVRCRDCKRDSQTAYMPTPEQIAEEAAKIRAEWSSDELRHRGIRRMGAAEDTYYPKVYRYVG